MIVLLFFRFEYALRVSLHSGLLEYQSEATNTLDQDGVILKMDFINWAQQKKLSLASAPVRERPSATTSGSQSSLSLDPPGKFVLYHYNGQGASGKEVVNNMLFSGMQMG